MKSTDSRLESRADRTEISRSRIMSAGSCSPGIKVLGCLLAVFWLSAVPGFAQRAPEAPTGVEVRAEPVAAFDPEDPSRRRFGELEFRGGLILTSNSKSFGGFSGLRVQKDGSRFIAISDMGSWFQGRIVYSGERPAGIAGAVLAPVLAAEGRPSGRLDTESLAENGKTTYVGLERRNQIWRFEFGKKGLLSRGAPIAVPSDIAALPDNQGLEALEFIPKKRPLGGTLVAISEQGLDQAGNIKAYLIGGPEPGIFTVRRTGGYDVSDAALLPGGDLLILERRYSLLAGVSMRIRRIPLDVIRPGAVVDGRTVMEADGRCVIDNMEALSVHRARSGRVLLTLLSDDNFSPQQRTILLQFEMSGK